MLAPVRGLINLVGRLALVAIFLVSAAGNKIPRFNAVAELMASKGIPEAKWMLVGAIVFLIAGSISIALGYFARLGAVLLLTFLALASYYFHDFWHYAPADERFQQQFVEFLKNLSIMGAMLMVIANGSGWFSLDNRRRA